MIFTGILKTSCPNCGKQGEMKISVLVPENTKAVRAHDVVATCTCGCLIPASVEFYRDEDRKENTNGAPS